MEAGAQWLVHLVHVRGRAMAFHDLKEASFARLLQWYIIVHWLGRYMPTNIIPNTCVIKCAYVCILHPERCCTPVDNSIIDNCLRHMKSTTPWSSDDLGAPAPQRVSHAHAATPVVQAASLDEETCTTESEILQEGGGFGTAAADGLE